MNTLHSNQSNSRMRAIKSKGSKIEDLLAKSLYKKGIRYRRNVKSVYGCPDICIKKFKIALFCDSEFWHGKDWESTITRFKSNQEFWINKISRNIQRDIEVNEYLMTNGWTVLRFWGNEIIKNFEDCLDKVLVSIDQTRKIKIK